MKEIEFVRYEPDHALQLFGEALEDQDDRFAALAEFHAKYPATTVFNEYGKVIACFGVTPYWEGTAEVWALFSEDIVKYGVNLVRVTRQFLDDLQRGAEYRRLQCQIASTNTAAKRFIEHFGFVCEGTMSKYGPNGEDTDIYARVA